MKYKYSLILYTLQFVFVLFMEYALLLAIYKFNNDLQFMLKTFFGAILLLFTIYSLYFKEFANKSVELTETCINFNSFRFKDVKMKNSVSFGVKYADIFSIEARHIPLIGTWAIKINARNLPHKMTVSFCFKKHKDLYGNIIRLVMQHNPNAYIDNRLKRYAEKYV